MKSALSFATAAWLLATALPGLASDSLAGDAVRGRELLLSRHETGCILCHVVPGIAQGGTLGPPLDHVPRRYSATELEQRIADARQFNPNTLMPPTRSVEGLTQVAPAYRGQPLLTEQALKDIVAYLLTPVSSPSPPAGPIATPGTRTP